MIDAIYATETVALNFAFPTYLALMLTVSRNKTRNTEHSGSQTEEENETSRGV